MSIEACGLTKRYGDKAAVNDLTFTVHLTGREREVLQAIAGGWTNGEIAQRLNLAESTVKTHVGRVLAKIGARDRVQAVIFAYDTRLVRPA